MYYFLEKFTLSVDNQLFEKTEIPTIYLLLIQFIKN